MLDWPSVELVVGDAVLGPERRVRMVVSVELVYTWHAPEQLRNSLTVYFTSPYFLCGSGLKRLAWQPAQSGL